MKCCSPWSAIISNKIQSNSNFNIDIMQLIRSCGQNLSTPDVAIWRALNGLLTYIKTRLHPAGFSVYQLPRIYMEAHYWLNDIHSSRIDLPVCSEVHGRMPHVMFNPTCDAKVDTVHTTQGVPKAFRFLLGKLLEIPHNCLLAIVCLACQLLYSSRRIQSHLTHFNECGKKWLASL